MTEPDSSPRRLTNIAGVVGLVTAVVGLAGTGLTVWHGMKDEDGKAAAEAPAEETLDNVPAQIDGYMSGPAYVDFSAAHVLCYDKDDEGSCVATAELVQRGARAIRLRETLFSHIPDPAFDPLDLIVLDDLKKGWRDRRPEGIARVDLVDYEVTREGICISRDARSGGAARTMAFGVSRGDLTPLSSAGLAAYRTGLREVLAGEAVGDRQCWRFKLEGDKLRQDYFIDGVLQPDGVTLFDTLPAGARPPLRFPG